MKQLYYFLLVFTGILTACSDGYDDRKNISSPGEVTAESWVDVTFNMQLPSQSNNISTYGMTENDETNIEHVDVIAFLQDAGKEYFAYQTEARVIQDAGSNKKKFTVKLKRSDALHRFVVLANCQAEVDGLGSISTTDEKDDVLSALIHTHASAWQADEIIPMWGETENAIAITNSTTSIPEIQIIRMLARIDVLSTVDDSKFKIEEVHFYHHNTSGHIVPESDNFDGATHTALLATVPANPGRAQTAQVYTNVTNNYIREIYAFETDSALPTTQQPCLVIGGSYNGGKKSYYKIAFIDEKEEEISILRNHLYTVKITDIKGEGYSNADAACKSKAINIAASVLVWNQGILTNIVYDDEYMLGVSQNLYEIPRDAKEYAVTVTTDYPDCWKAAVTEGNQWITLGAETTCTGSYKKDDLPFNVAVNNSGSERTGIITITAGHLVQVIEVVQGIKSSLEIIVTDRDDTPINQLYYETFIGAPLETQDFKVIWEPDMYTYSVGYTNPGSYPFSFGTGDNPLNITPVPGGSKLFSITPPVIRETELDLTENGNPFITKNIRLSFSVTDGTITSTDQIDLVQEVFGVFGYPEDFYTMDGGQYSLKVKSNVSWTAEPVSGGIVTSLQTISGGPNENGEEVLFTISDGQNTSLDNPGLIKFTFTTPLGKTGVTYVPIAGLPGPFRDGHLSNCYFLDPDNKQGISIPVAQANRDGIKVRISDTDEIGWKLIWTDHPNGIAPDAAISEVVTYGTGAKDGRLLVYPGTSEGNAVVAVTVEGTVRWSWHIWVTKYDPEEAGNSVDFNGYTWMDRNLGALSNQKKDTKTIGVVYQWGRKDPFPGAEDYKKFNPFPVYNESGGDKTIPIITVPVDNNLENSIENPEIFYLGTPANYQDWYGVSTGFNKTELWCETEGVKTMYDPCPEGWIIPQNPNNVFGGNIHLGNYTLDAANYAVEFMGTVWPLAGQRKYTTGSYVPNDPAGQLGTYGFYYWGQVAQSGENITWYFRLGDNWGFSAYSQHERANGGSVRCIKE